MEIWYQIALVWASAGADLLTTKIALEKGGVEANPFLKEPFLRYFLKTLVVVFLSWGLYHLGGSWWLAGISSGLWVAAATWNLLGVKNGR